MKVKIYYAEIAPELESTEFDLNSVKVKGECIIGRSPECGLVLEGSDLSRQHAKFLTKDGNYYFSDLGSRNGSLFNDELVEPNREYILNSGDRIRIGDFILKMEQEEELAATVFKVIDPSFFKSKQPQVEDSPKPEEIVAQTLPIEGLTDRVISYPIIEENLVDRVPADQPPLDLVDDGDEEDTPAPVIAEQPLSALVNDELDRENILDRVSQEYPLPTLADDEWVEEDLSNNLVLEEQSASALVVDEFDEEVTPDRAISEHPASALVEDECEKDILSRVPEEQLAPALVEDEFDEKVIPDRAIAEQPASALVVDKLDELDTSEHSRVIDAQDELSAADLNKGIQLETPSTISTAVAVAGVVSGFNANNNGLGAELLNKKQIVLIAHDTKIADLTDIVDRHKDFLAKCLTISWTSIADSLRQETGMVVSKEIPSGSAGGFQNIAGLVNSGDVLAVIFLKDFFAQSQAGQANEEALLRLCNINEILLATNIATADAIVHYLQS